MTRVFLCQKANPFCKPFITLLIAAFVLATPVPVVYSLPEGSQVENGEANFEVVDGNTMNITASNNAIINFQSFNVASNETVNFIQPDAASNVLNRVIGPDPTNIMGSIFANGNMFIVNTQGINVGSSANICANGCVLSSLNISNADFISGKLNFAMSGSYSSVTNQGFIKSADGGYIALIGAQVNNSGTLLSPQGTVLLASGEKMTMSIDPSNMVSIVIDEAVKEAIQGKESLVINTGNIYADGGKVTIEGNQTLDLYKYVINQEGCIKANSVVEDENGVVELIATGGDINLNGTIEAKAAETGDGGRVYVYAHQGDLTVGKDTIIDTSAGTIEGDAGFMEVSGDQNLFLNGGVFINNVYNGKKGQVLFDPYDIIINEAVVHEGSDLSYEADHDISVSASVTVNDGNLVFDAGNDIMFSTGGAATVDTGNLTLTAGNDIDIYTDVTVKTTTSGNITVTAAGDVTMGTADSVDNLSLTATSGNVDIQKIYCDSLIVNAGTDFHGYNSTYGLYLEAYVYRFTDLDITAGNDAKVLFIIPGFTLVDVAAVSTGASSVTLSLEDSVGGDRGSITYGLTSDFSLSNIYGQVTDSAGVAVPGYNVSVTVAAAGSNFISGATNEFALSYFAPATNLDITGLDGSTLQTNCGNFTYDTTKDLVLTNGYPGVVATITNSGDVTIPARDLTVAPTGTGASVKSGATGKFAIYSRYTSAAFNVTGLDGSTLQTNIGNFTYDTTKDLQLLGLNVAVTDTGNVAIPAGTLYLGSSTYDFTTSVNVKVAATTQVNANVYKGGDVTIDSPGSDLYVGTINVPEGTATLSTTTSGSILDSSSTITASTLTMTSAEAIGATDNYIGTTVSSLTATASSGGVYVDETNAITLNAISATDVISIQSGGTITVSNSLETQNDAGCYLTADGDITLDSNASISTGSGDITLWVDYDGTDPSTTGTLTKDFESDMVTTGNIYIKSNGSLTTDGSFLDNVMDAASLTLQSVNGDVTMESAIDFSTDNTPVYVYADRDLALNQDISAGTAALTLYADYNTDGTGALTRQAEANLSNSGDLKLRSGDAISTTDIVDIAGDTCTGALYVYLTNEDETLTVDSDISRTNKALNFYGYGDVTQGTTSNLSAGSGGVILHADYNNDGVGALSRDECSAIATSGSLTLYSASDITTSTVIDLAGDNLTGSRIVTTKGTADIVVDADITTTMLLSFTSQGGTFTQNDGTTLTAGTSGITISSSGNAIVEKLTTTDSGDVRITSSAGSVDAASADSLIKCTGGALSADLTISAASHIGTSTHINTTMDTLDLTASGGGIYVNETDSVSLNTISATAATTIVAGGTITTTEAINLSGALSLQSNNIAVGAAITGGANDITLAPNTGVTVGVGTGAGDYSLSDAEIDLITTTGTLTVGSANAGDLTADAVTAGSKNIHLRTGGDATMGDLSTTGTVSITATGNILDDGDANTKIEAAGNCAFTAGGYIGTDTTAFKAEVTNGTLSVKADGVINNVSVNGEGTVTPTDTLTLVGSFAGKVLWNGIWINEPAKPINNTAGPSSSAAVEKATMEMYREPELVEEESENQVETTLGGEDKRKKLPEYAYADAKDILTSELSTSDSLVVLDEYFLNTLNPTIDVRGNEIVYKGGK
ncbi:MAG: filamentous hemagglutinin N-terminal domain-containing protein [Candidatus Omnitrophica bacterium]|nr:filamentous hemagglutinin N-terminal domain-containing protein [Candidatus Omnitrophota bacterium]